MIHWNFSTKIFRFLKNNWYGPGGYRAVLLLAYPLFFQAAASIIMQFCDRKFLANSSTNEMAAALPSGQMLFACAIFFTMMLAYSNPLTAQYYGADQKKFCVNILWTGVIMAFLCSGVLLILMPLVGWLGLPLVLNGETLRYAWQYFLIQIPGQIFLCISTPFFAFFTGRGKTFVVSYINIAVSLLNIPLDWIMIFGHFGCPKLGILGAGLATSLSLCMGMIVVIVLVLFSTNQMDFPTRNLQKSFRTDIFFKLFRLGGFSGLQHFSNSFKFMVIIFLVGTLGEQALASTSIALTIIMVSFMPIVALEGANMIICGQFIGAGNRNEAESTTYRVWLIGFIYTILALVWAIWASSPIIDLFAPDIPTPDLPFKTVADDAWKILVIMATWMLSDTGRYIFGANLRAAGDTNALLKMNLLVSWILGIPVFVILTLWIKAPVYLVWLYFIVVSLAEALLIYSRFRSGYWKKIELVHK